MIGRSNRGSANRWGLLVGVTALIVGVVAPAASGEQPDLEPARAGIAAEWTADSTAHKLIAGSSSGRYSFGYAVAVDGDTIVIGAPRADGDQGKAYIVYNYVGPGDFDALGLSCEHNLMKFPDGNCGRSVAVDGARAAIGMPHWPGEPNLDDRGAVWVLEHSGSEWEEWPLVRGSVLGGYFGEAVAIEGSTLAIGVPEGDTNSASSSVRLYEPTGPPGSGHWSLEQTLQPAGDDPNFAWNIDIEDSTMALGTTSSAFVFHGSPGSYAQPQEFDFGFDPNFGKVDVALDGKWLVVGHHDEGGSPPGAVHVYKWNGAKYVKKQTLTPPDGDHELYGWSVAISGKTIVVGDPRDHGEAPYAGAVHRYTLDDGTWSFVETMTANDAADEDQYGWAVAISPDWIVVGSPWDDNSGGTDSGAVYIYEHNEPEPPPVECDGLTPTITGTDGDDELVGTSGFDIIAGLGGDDVIEGRGGDDLLCGGPGDDVIRGGAGTDRILGEAGNDVIKGDKAWDVLFGGGGDDRIHGGGGADIIYGNKGNDTLKGNAGIDSIYGGPGKDLVIDGAGEDTMWGGGGSDTVDYSLSKKPIDADLVIGIVEFSGYDDFLISIENIIGSAFGDTIVGNSRKNLLKGGAGPDALFGKGADDVLKGGRGKDTANGGSGRDTCVAEKETSCER